MRTQVQTIPKPLGRLELSVSQKIFSFLAIILLLWLIIVVKSSNLSTYEYGSLILVYTVFVTSFQLSRLLSATFYKPSYNRIVSGYVDDKIMKKYAIATAAAAPTGNGRIKLRKGINFLEGYSFEAYEPVVSFVIPCKNEEAAIENTVSKCFEVDYPRKKIEVIVINDGSTDGTGTILRRLEKKFPTLKVVHWKENRGKRAGMAAGFNLSKGEIVMQLDSDSYLAPEGFRNVIRPFINPKIGGVSVHTDPQNADKNWLTKMQSAYYFMSFRILKAAESSYGAVFCLSGCASAYRKEVVMPILDKWLNEKFLGLPVTWGDDRGLTNWVLKLGYRSIYTDECLAYTIVPENFKGFLKQQIRWKKGWFVNSIFASKFIFKKDPFVALTYFFPLMFVTLTTPFVAARAIFYVPLAKNPAALLIYFSGVLLIAALIVIYYHYLSPDNKYWPYLFIWASINMVFLSMLLLYALPTIQDRKWGTR